MNKLDELINKMVDSTTDEKALQSLAETKREIAAERQAAETEKKEMADKYSDLLNRYKKAVMEAPLPPIGTPEEQGKTSQPFTDNLEEAFHIWEASQNKKEN